MRDLDSGVLPVGQKDRMVGMLTDRDIHDRLAGEVAEAVLHETRRAAV